MLGNFRRFPVLCRQQYNVQLPKRLSSISDDTVMFSWGAGNEGQLGHAKVAKTNGLMGSAFVQTEPRKLLRSKRFTKVAIGEHCSIALTPEGQAFGCGTGLISFEDKTDQAIREFTLLDFGLPKNKKIVDVSFGNKHAAAIDEDGKVYVWGDNGSWFRGGGQLGLGHKASVQRPTLVSFLSEDLAAKVVSVKCGERHTLFLLDDGDLFASGVGEYGRLGTGNTEDSLLPTQVSLELLGENDSIESISAGYDHSLALSKTGKVLSWGRNQSGQLGQGDSYMDMYSMEDLPRPIELSDLPQGHRITQIATGNARSMCISSGGDCWLWGARLSHQPAKIDRQLVFGGEKVIKAAMGGDSSRSAIFFLLESGSVFVQGDVSSDMLGRGDLTRLGKISVPERMPFFKNMKVLDIFSGCGQHVFARVKVDQQ